MIEFITGLWQYIVVELEGELHWLVSAPAAHFALSAFAGYLVYYVTSTILSRGSSTTFRELTSREDFSTHRFSLLLALSSSVFVHILQDYTLNMF